MEKKVVDFVLDIPVEFKIKEGNGETWGKWILRKTIQDLLPPEFIWQSKRPLEYGSGMNRLREIISARITDEEFKENFYPVEFMNKEHLYYYKIYMKEIGHIPEPKRGQKSCPGCGAGMGISAFHCKVCGKVLDWRDI